MSGERLRVAVAEDEPMNRKRLVRLLLEENCEVVDEVVLAHAQGRFTTLYPAGAPK